MANSTMGDERQFEDLQAIFDETLQEILQIWENMYGESQQKKSSRLEFIYKQVTDFCNELVQQELDKKHALISRIEESLETKSKMEKLLQIKKKIGEIDESNQMPLAEVDINLLKLIDDYNSIVNSRLEMLKSFQQKEIRLCFILSKPVEKFILENGSVPSEPELEMFQKRIKDMEKKAENVTDTFEKKKAELAQLMNELGVSAETNIEKSAFTENNEMFPISVKNLDKLEETLKYYQNMKENNKAEAAALRQELKTVWQRIKKDPQELAIILSHCIGISVSDIKKLSSEVNECRQIQKRFLKEVIQEMRNELDVLWEKCYFSQFERDCFSAYKTDVFSDDVLTLHEFEVEKLQQYYNTYNETFKLVKIRKDVWTKLEQLERQAKDPERLFKNRGGQLLQEERERKSLEKELFKIEKKLKIKIQEFEEREGKSFMYFGINIRDIIENEYTEKNNQRQKEKMARAHRHQENLVLRTPNNLRPAVSTPNLSSNSSVASYKTFQENLDPSTPNFASTPANSGSKSENKSKTPKSRIP
uniref:Protein regulator of cytokinesis 1 n=1 Tax=Clastoptera arizonana TaxID=38151 RepID=A0A1B6EG14_9HEMI